MHYTGRCLFTWCNSYSCPESYYHPFVDLVTFQPLELVLPVTVLFVALLGLPTPLSGRQCGTGSWRYLADLRKQLPHFWLWLLPGGAVLPLIYGKLAVNYSTQTAYWICVPSYLIIMYYAFIGYKAGKKNGWFKRNIWNASPPRVLFQRAAIWQWHIHDTFRIETVEADKDDYILQRLNNRVFKNIPELQNNIERVTKHLHQKYLAIPGANVKRECLALIPARDGKSWIQDEEGNYWRMYIFITDHRSYNIVDSQGKAFEGGKAIGKFQALLSDLPGDPLFETIPFFMILKNGFDNFNRIKEENPLGRAERPLKKSVCPEKGRRNENYSQTRKRREKFR